MPYRYANRCVAWGWCCNREPLRRVRTAMRQPLLGADCLPVCVWAEDNRGNAGEMWGGAKAWGSAGGVPGVGVYCVPGGATRFCAMAVRFAGRVWGTANWAWRERQGAQRPVPPGARSWGEAPIQRDVGREPPGCADEPECAAFRSAQSRWGAAGTQTRSGRASGFCPDAGGVDRIEVHQPR